MSLYYVNNYTYLVMSSIISNWYYDLLAKCDFPSNTQVMGYVNPLLEGMTVNFSCPTGQILTGSRTSTCLGNGEWDLYPMESNIRCKGE